MADITTEYKTAKEKYGQIGVDTDDVLELLGATPISVHCWQLDDCGGFETSDAALSGGGILSTGSYPGKARNLKEMMDDLEKVLSLIPGKKKVNIHAIYGDFKGKKVGRTEIMPEHFEGWVKWAKKNEVGLDFNPSLFSHPLAESGYTLASLEKKTRDFWIEHVKRSREISNYIGRELGIICMNNTWIPDGSKDNTVTRFEHRQTLKDALDEIFEQDYPEENMMDSLESKLFGIGLESYTVGSNEFYLSYALQKGKFITFDAGHFHPTELVSDKISAAIPFVKGIQLHLSRGVRWDSDHVTTLSEEIIAIMQEIVRAGALDKVHIGTDFFDGSVNRIGALALGARAVSKALLLALLEPASMLREYEMSENFFARLALLEDLKTAPMGAVWDMYCNKSGIPNDIKWIDEALDYEKEVLSKR